MSRAQIEKRSRRVTDSSAPTSFLTVGVYDVVGNTLGYLAAEGC